jgi:ribonuclease Z
MDEFNLYVIGSGSALSMHGRHPSAQVIQYGQFYALIDCGEGTQDRLRQAGIKAFKISIILISHLHGDHVFGLPGLLGSLSHLRRTEPLTIYGPAGIKGMLESIFSFSNMHFSYPLHIVESTPSGIMSIYSNDCLDIMTFPLDHRVACNGYLLKEINVRPKFRKDKVAEFGLSPDQIKAIGRGEEVLVNGNKVPATTFLYPVRDPLSYGYCSDTRYNPAILPWIDGVSVLYHETTYMQDMQDLAKETGHSTAQQAAQIAQKANASCLITGHFSSRYKDLNPLVTEAKAWFGHVILAEEGKKYNLKSLINEGDARIFEGENH